MNCLNECLLQDPGVWYSFNNDFKTEKSSRSSHLKAFYFQVIQFAVYKLISWSSNCFTSTAHLRAVNYHQEVWTDTGKVNVSQRVSDPGRHTGCNCDLWPQPIWYQLPGPLHSSPDHTCKPAFIIRSTCTSMREEVQPHVLYNYCTDIKPTPSSVV